MHLSQYTLHKKGCSNVKVYLTVKQIEKKSKIRKNQKEHKKKKKKTQKRKKHPSSIGTQVLNSYLFSSFGRFERNSVIHNHKCCTQLCISIYV